MGELRRILTDPPTDAELKMAKDASIQSLPGTFETMSATASTTAGLFIYSRPLDYYATLPDRYRAITAQDVVAAAQKTIHPDNLLIVAVGDRKKIEPPLKELNLAPIEHADALGNILK